jgi:phenylalanyl-tRNA synthetase beta chain
MVVMRIPLSWLNEFIEMDQAPYEIGKILTMAGLEVDAIEKVSLPCDGVVVGKVLDTHKHPEADQLTVAAVTDGTQTYQVVCGAPNCRPGIKVAFAMVGANLKDEEGKAFKIKKSKLRGVESNGMLCSAKEVGISEEDHEIIELGQDLKEGTNLNDLYGDTVFEISLTPNLGHCSSVSGVARELSAATERPYRLPPFQLTEGSKPNLVTVKVKNQKDCPRYACRSMQDVTIGPSPDWLKKRLEAAGLRSINNVVDVTNYVMLELGHPLHAFDADNLEGHTLIIKNATPGEKFITLDEKERVLEDEDLMICDQTKPVALAGVMGGLHSEVTDATKNLVLEAACFAPSVIRRTSKRLGLMTDASKRFERGSDPNILGLVLDRAAALIQQVAGGTICQGTIDIAGGAFPKKHIKCRLSRINQLLGTRLSVSEVENIFSRLEFISKWDGNDTFDVQVPTYRNDLNEEIDLIEETARVYGYDNITKTHAFFQSSKIPHSPSYVFEKEMRTRLISQGLQEFLTCDLIGPSLLSVAYGTEKLEPSWIKVLNPTSIEQSILRTSLLPGLLHVVKYNWDHQNRDIAGFEIGNVHFKEGEHYREQPVAGIVLSGKAAPHHWKDKPRDFDFYDLKGMFETLFEELKVDVAFKSHKHAALHPGRQASIYCGSLEIGSFGEVHPAVVRRLDVPQPIFFAEVNLYDLLQVRPKSDTQMQEIAVYPGSERDWTITMQEETPVEKLLKAVQGQSSRLLESVSLQDIYRSDKLGKGLKNVTLRFFYRDRTKTIAQEKVDSEHQRIVENVNKLLNTG